MGTSKTVLVLAAFLLVAMADKVRAAPTCADASMLPGVGDGACWGSPFARVQQAIDAVAAAGGGEVWVREGTYFENVAIPDGVAVYGGFAGGELARAERDPVKHPTILDGGRRGTTVRIFGGPATRVDGFTIQNGLTGRDLPGGMLGGGLYVGGEAVVANNVIARNEVNLGWGGGLYVDGEGGGGAPLITGNLIYDNRASSGGGIFAVMGHPRIVGNVVLRNTPGGMFVWATSAVIANNVVLDNNGAIVLASGRGARVVHNVVGRSGNGVAIDLDFSSVIANNYFFSNGIAVASNNTVVSDPNAVVNNAFFQNNAVATSNVTLGAGNVHQSCLPNGVSLTGGFHLSPGSPCIDAGLASAEPPDLLTDRDGEPRVVGAAPDIGADEVAWPATYLSAGGTAGKLHWFTTPVAVTLTAAGGPGGLALTGTQYSQDGGATWLPYADPVALAEEGQVTRFGYRSTATDGASELVELAKEVVIGVDTLVPVVDLTVPPLPESGWYTTAPIISASVSDPAPGSGLESATWRCSGYGATAYTAPFAFPCDGGPATLVFEARDVAGNLRSVSVPLMVDVAPPTTWSWFESYPPRGWWAGDAVGHIEASNPGSGVALVEYSLDQVTWLPYLGAAVVSAEGRNVLSSRAWDPLGRVGAVYQYPVSIDRTPPVTTAALAGAGAGPWYPSGVTVTLAASDALSGVLQTRYAVAGAAAQPYTAPFTVAAEGVTAVTFGSTDLADNAEATRSVDVRIDRTPPVTTARLAGTTGPDGSFVTAVTVTLDATDALSGVASTTYRVDGGPAQAYAGPFTVAADGQHQVTFSSTDAAGVAEAPGAVAFAIDRTPPTCTVLASDEAGLLGWHRAPVTVSVGSAGGPASVEYRVGGQAWAPYTAPVVLGTEGIWVVQCRAIDAAGNAGTGEATVAIDLSCPVTRATLQGTAGLDGWFTSSVSVTLAATDSASGVASTSASLDGLLWLPYAAPLAVVTEGTTAVQFSSTDFAGCVEPPGGVLVSIDETPPAIASTSPANGATRVSRTAAILVTYREPVWAGPAVGSLTVTYRRGGRISTVPIRWTVSGAVLTITPTVALPSSASIRVTLPAGAVRDVAGLPSPAGRLDFWTR